MPALALRSLREYWLMPLVTTRPGSDAAATTVLPLLGRLVARDEASYRDLAESIRMHPNQETLLEMLRTAGFAQTRYHNLTGGIVAVHRGYKI